MKRQKFNYMNLKKLDRIEYLLRINNLQYHFITIRLVYELLIIIIIVMIFTLLFVSAFNLNEGIKFLQKIAPLFYFFKYVIILSLIFDIFNNIIIYDKRLKLKEEMMLSQ